MKNILDVKYSTARAFFLRSDIYFSEDLPPYFNFNNMLSSISKAFIDNSNLLEKLKFCEAQRVDTINHILYANKDGQYGWRNFQIINPALYVYLVHTITEETNWNLIKNRLQELHCATILCSSIPVLSRMKGKSQTGTQITEWWKNVEQASIKILLDYNVVHQTDIANFYPSIYTHSIAWAVHGKMYSKKNKQNENLLGNKIDSLMMSMQGGQTNGIPQGSVLMDFISEIVLAFADNELGKKISKIPHKIIRYRDDYRIFTINKYDGELILKELAQVLLDLGLKINSSKTQFSDDILSASMKEDKFYKIANINECTTDLFQNRLIKIYDFCLRFNNSNQMKKTLIKFNDDLEKHISSNKKINDTDVLISIVLQIALKNVNLYSQCIQTLSILLSLNDDSKDEFIKKIKQKFEHQPFHSFIEIWLQRLMMPYSGNIQFSEKLCDIIQKVQKGRKPKLWDDTWIHDNSVKAYMKAQNFVDMEIIKNLPKRITRNEVDNYNSKSL